MTWMTFDDMMECTVEVNINIKRYIHLMVCTVIVYNRCRFYIQE